MGETTRLYLCPAMAEVHAKLRVWMEEAGLAVKLDPAGNLRGRTSASGPVMLVGSHLDTVPRAGAFDGVLGVVLGVEAAEVLQDEDVALEVVGFAEEEGVRFGQPFLGSLALIGSLGADTLALRDAAGLTVAEVLRAFGGKPESVGEARLREGEVRGYLEMHIEQGPVLDAAGEAIGLVTAIAGQTRARVEFRGEANHAGTTPMTLRRDALAAAAAWVGSVEREARGTNGLVATVGRLTVKPGAANVIPGRVETTLDVRHPDDEARRFAAERLLHAARAEGTVRGVEVQADLVLEQAAVAMDEGMTRKLEHGVHQAGFKALRMVSGAGHDAMVMAQAVPAGMLFVRSPGGRSHSPAETVEVADVAMALEVLVRFLRA